MKRSKREWLKRAKKYEAEAAEYMLNARVNLEQSLQDNLLGSDQVLNAQLCLVKAKVARNLGVASFPGLFDEKGRRIRAQLVDSRYGKVWACEDHARHLIGFVPFGSSSRIQRELGLHQEIETAEARVILAGDATGMAGCMSQYIAVHPEVPWVGPVIDVRDANEEDAVVMGGAK